MKLLLLFSSFALFTTFNASAQPKPKVLKKVGELQMPRTVDDDMPGTRGASVTWHPTQKKYYAVFAGNAEYPLAVFDATYNRLSADSTNAMADSRGLWYNPVEKRIEGNGYSDWGWYYYKLDEKGIPFDYVKLFTGLNQPTEQCVGSYSASDKAVLFLSGSQVHFYDYGSATDRDSLALHWGRTAKDGQGDNETPSLSNENYNYTTVVYTNIPGAEIGALNITNKQIELYNKKDGFLTQVLTLPDDAVVQPNFNFAYANGTYWLFNIELRKWVGYK